MKTTFARGFWFLALAAGLAVGQNYIRPSRSPGRLELRGNGPEMAAGGERAGGRAERAREPGADPFRHIRAVWKAWSGATITGLYIDATAP